ncbi:TetR/AcrR family transcriptional regulator [Stenotrophomonas sp. 24(2023)]|uniref:TetR/AcrR family transcriptional regulator n=1 Tax=Stenotrophomonas sp. 24(2023) TaxID=3068324 RepID=UPI0027E1461E|nr:TetR/AcrR family transcriptional regulator [Stenotrophomonas sp. 24(2023)]WMJ70618.1 TetR family transcriptional regulator [Stenotrophomonas sp. 24(2023)]
MPAELSPKAAEIVAYTRTLLEAGGYNSFSYADIAAQVNISKASIHHHFPSKVDLVREVVARYRAEARTGLSLLERQLDNPLGELTAYADYWSTCIAGGTSSFCIGAMLAAELPTLPAEVAVEVRGHFDDLSGWLTTTMERGSARHQLRLQGTPQVEARMFMASVHGAMLAARGLGDPLAFESLVRVAIHRLASTA